MALSPRTLKKGKLMEKSLDEIGADETVDVSDVIGNNSGPQGSDQGPPDHQAEDRTERPVSLG